MPHILIDVNEYFARTWISIRYIIVFWMVYLCSAVRGENPVRQKSSGYLPICGLDVLQELKDAGEMQEAIDSEFCVVDTFLIESDNVDHPILSLMYPQLRSPEVTA